jgi:DNA helicase-2/ATP-dependent DNA helicase PcrA
MSWDQGLLNDQKVAVQHCGSHARLLAGPGTGKTHTLTRRLCHLVQQQRIDPKGILALTFTRAAAYELSQRVEKQLGTGDKVSISTLHSFALRLLLRNSKKSGAIKQPLRIADDWEERQVILEDLKVLLKLDRIEQARELFNRLSADWQSLTADEEGWDERFPDPKFLGAWHGHRGVFGYTLRAELVYQLKRALEQQGNFDLGPKPTHLIVDEYQDLNRCDLAVIAALANRGAETFVAGDDDQSIYGFRQAHPQGIRRFPQDYPNTRQLALEVCKRCDPKILELALFVARQDYERIEKPIRAEEGRAPGQVVMLHFPDQDAEAVGVAGLCRHLLDRYHLAPHEILILLRSDRNAGYSSSIRTALSSADVPVSVRSNEDDEPLNKELGRKALAVLRIVDKPHDHLAWRTLLQLRPNQLGPGAMKEVYQLAKSKGIGFAIALRLVADDPPLAAPPHGSRIQAEMRELWSLTNEVRNYLGNNVEPEKLLGTITQLASRLGGGAEEQEAVVAEFKRAVEVSRAGSVVDLLSSIEASDGRIEQEVEDGKVNILTMHKAKGLDAKAVIVVALEDELIPGRAQGEDRTGDERRLLYVSLTRAKNFLFMTYCDRRTGQQQHSGRSSGSAQRSLTQFLRDGPVRPQLRGSYLASLCGK